MSRRHGSKDKSKRHSKGSGHSHRSGEMKTRHHDDVKVRHASYPPMGNVHMNSGMPIPDAMQSSGGMPQGEEMTNETGGGPY